MDFLEVKRFLAWYWEECAKGLVLPMYYNCGIRSLAITEECILTLQLVSLGIKKISTAQTLALEALLQGLNEVNDAIQKGNFISRPDVF